MMVKKENQFGTERVGATIADSTKITVRAADSFEMAQRLSQLHWWKTRADLAQFREFESEAVCAFRLRNFVFPARTE